MQAQVELEVSHAGGGGETTYPTALGLTITPRRNGNQVVGYEMRVQNWAGWVCRAAGPQDEKLYAAVFDTNCDGKYGAENDSVGVDLNGDGWVMTTGNYDECVRPGEPFTWGRLRLALEWNRTGKGPALVLRGL